MTTGKKRLLVAAAIAAAAAVFACVLFFCDPMTSMFYPRCPSQLLTGYDCPGCGTLRALHALMHGDIDAAWNYNAAVFFAIPMVGVADIGDPFSAFQLDSFSNKSSTAVLAAE